MEYYDRIPTRLAGEVSIPSKWDIGGACPNCLAEARDGILLLVDRGDDLSTPESIQDMADGVEHRFDIQCSEYEYGTLGCSFEFSLKSISATVAEDWSEPY